jgi:hypothetical protein
MKLEIADAKRRLLLPELARLLGVPGKIPERDGEVVPCFWSERHRHGDKRPSFNFHSGLTRYRCFGCGAAGDAGDLITEWCCISPEEGLRRFLEMAGGDSPTELTRSPVAEPRAAAPPADPWNDSAEKEAKRRCWPALELGSSAVLETVAELRGLNAETVRFALRAGWLRFCTLAGCGAWVLLSGCGRIAQARRLDGAEWERSGHRFKAWSLPGSCATVPLGLQTLSERTPFVGVASGGPDTLALLEFILAEERTDDCAMLGILGESVKLAAPMVKACAGRIVRLFAHNDDAGRRSAATWAEQLTEAGAKVDAFSFAAFGCKDLNDFLKLPNEARNCEVLPT